MLICWAGQGHPIYAFMQYYQKPVYISYIGATNLQPLFISCAGWQGLFYLLTLCTEYFLRRSGRLQYWFKKDERNLLFAAICLAIVGELGILFVAIFNIKNHKHAHDSLLVVFLVFVGLSGVMLITQYCMMGLHYRTIHVHHKYLNKFTLSFYAKVIFVVVAIILAAFFGAVSNESVSSCFEWTLAFWYIVIFLIFAWDLWPASKKHHKNAPYIKNWEKYDYYMYNKNYGTHPYEKYAKFDDQYHSQENGETFVQQTSDSSIDNTNGQYRSTNGEQIGYRNTNREFTDEELAQYPMTNEGENYPIPQGQQVPVYENVDSTNTNTQGYNEDTVVNQESNQQPLNQQQVAEAYNDGATNDEKKGGCVIV